MGWRDLIDEDGLGPEDFVSVSDLGTESLADLPETAHLQVMDEGYPEFSLARSGGQVQVTIAEHIYSKFWWHKYHARVFADAMVRAVRRFRADGAPFGDEDIESDDDIHLWVRWTYSMDANVAATDAAAAAKSAFDAVWERANAILEDSDSVLILGKDTGDGMDRLLAIKASLEARGYFVYIIKEQPDRLGESIIQKVLRHALSSKFVVIENTDASGHLYEVAHVAKMAECVSAILQEEGKGATWMFEDAYFRNLGWKKFDYQPAALDAAVASAASWAEDFVQRFARHQRVVLPWLRKTP